MNGYAGMSMPDLYALVTEETTNKGPLENGARFWEEAAKALNQGYQNLSQGLDTHVRQNWQDQTFHVAFEDPVNVALELLKKSESVITEQQQPQVALRNLIGFIDATANAVGLLYQQWLKLQTQLLAAATAAAATAIWAEMERLRLLAAVLVDKLDQDGYAETSAVVQAAAQGHQSPNPSVNGGAMATSDRATASSASANGPSSASSASVTGPGEASASASPGGQQASTADPQGETGLAGGGAPGLTAPATPTMPPISPPTPAPSAPMGTSPVAPVGVLPAAAGGAAGSGSRGGWSSTRTAGRESIPTAARVTGIVSASTGQAPTLPAESTGSIDSARSSRTPAAMAPLALGAPMMASPLVGTGLRGLIGGPKLAGTNQGRRTAEESGRVAGVPRALRGRTSRTDSDDTFPTVLPVARRRNRRDDQETGPETVQLLDEEIWQVQQTHATTEQAPTSRVVARV
ncbi:hypothetical protein WEI85_24800 [Actinomycetes bacterium KLBMP 9797]